MTRSLPLPACCTEIVLAATTMTSKKAASKLAVSPSKRAAEVDEDVAGADGGATVKRRKGLGVRVIGGRIYDSDNGKTCHQCRQKTIDFMATCKASSGSRPCTQHYCAKCLLNRYGEKVAEVSRLPSWSCPKCRGDCNCSICLKKRGCMPTGILAHTAKATGFTSVAALLQKRPAARVDHNEASNSPSQKECKKEETLTPGQKSVNPKAKKRRLVVTATGEVEGPVANVLLQTPRATPKKDPVNVSSDVVSPSKKKKTALKLNLVVPASTKKKEKKKATLQGTLQEFLSSKSQKTVTSSGAPEHNLGQVKREDGQALPTKSKKKKSESKSNAVFQDKTSISKNIKVAKKNMKLQAKVKSEGGVETCETDCKLLLKKEAKRKEMLGDDSRMPKPGTLKDCKNERKEPKKSGQAGKTKLSAAKKEIVLPQGVPLRMVGGMDLPAEAIGPAAQFIEFCLAFQSVLGLRRGDAEAVLRELTKGRLVRKGSNSLLVQLHAKLLNMIESSFSDSDGEVTHSSNGKRSWLNILKKHLNERSLVFKGLSMDNEKAGPMRFKNVRPVVATVVLEEDLRTIKNAVEEGAESYENLGLYHKLQLLVILCDETLETQSMRDHMESANREYNQAQKGSREEVLAARKEVKDARQKIKDAEVAKLIALGSINGPLTHEDQEALLSKVLAETERAIAAASLEKEAISRMRKGRTDAVRTDAIAWGPDHRIFYKLKGFENMNRVVVQDCDVGEPGLDVWRVYSDMDEAVLMEYLLQRAKISRKKMLAEAGLKDSHIEGGDAEKENRIPNAVDVNVEKEF